MTLPQAAVIGRGVPLEMVKLSISILPENNSSNSSGKAVVPSETKPLFFDQTDQTTSHYIGEEDEDSPLTPVSSSSSVLRMERPGLPKFTKMFSKLESPRVVRPPTPPRRESPKNKGKIQGSPGVISFPNLEKLSEPSTSSSTDVEKTTSSTLGVEEDPNECIHPDVHVLRGNETLQTHFARANIHMLQGHRSSLYIRFHIYPDGIDQVAYVINALIDTGCEINIIKSGFLPYWYFQRSTSTLRLVAANGGRLGGGGRKTKTGLIHSRIGSKR